VDDTSEWPYAEDGVQRDEFAESLRLPIVRNPYPRFCYITAVMGNDDVLYRSVRPTDEELRVVASFHEQYIEYWYTESYKAKMRKRPFDLDGGANGRVLMKRPDGGWAYRRSSWTSGPAFVPNYDQAPTGLIEVLDRMHSYGTDGIDERWANWKKARPQLFPIVAPGYGIQP
jgi:hypothetical protein